MCGLSLALTDAGLWFVRKWLKRKAEAPTQVVALQMKKQGIPVEVAVFILARKWPDLSNLGGSYT